MKGFIVFVAIVALASAEEGKVEKRGSVGYAYGAPAPAYGAPAAVAAPVVAAAPAVATFKSGAPVGYSNAIPAAAIRNVETVGVTKTITPVVTKTTTYNTHSEPAVSVGHVQGYSQSAVGAAKVAPVQFSTQYTSYLNPTVGVNGPVTYAGPAHAVGPVAQVAYAQPAYAQAAHLGYAAPIGVGYAAHAHAAPAINLGYNGLGYAGHAGLLGLQGINLAQYAYAPQGLGLAYAQPAVGYAQAAPVALAAPAVAANQQYGAPVVSSSTYAAPSVTTYSKH